MSFFNFKTQRKVKSGENEQVKQCRQRAVNCAEEMAVCIGELGDCPSQLLRNLNDYYQYIRRHITEDFELMSMCISARK